MVETNNVVLANPGCIFVTPFQDNQPSPYIYSSNGVGLSTPGETPFADLQ